MSTDVTVCAGVLEWTAGGGGVLRDPARDLRPKHGDPLVPIGVIERYGLRPGALIRARGEPVGDANPPKVVEVEAVDGRSPAAAARLPRFEDLTAVDPHRPIRLETGREPLGTRVMDLLTPVGRGQRGLIVAPPRSGKTVLLRQIAAAVAANHPEIELITLLIDERPEEVTEAKRTTAGHVWASSNDRTFDEHVRLADLAFDRARRIAERGGHALVLLDSLTRLARAHNARSESGRTLTGGLDVKALAVPKRHFGSARALEEGGSLTVLATCLVETGSRADEVVFQEFKGTGNLEVVLDRRLADRRVWPAIDVPRSGTRKEEKLLAAETLGRLSLLRRTLAEMEPPAAMEALARQLGQDESNAAFLDRLGRAAERR